MMKEQLPPHYGHGVSGDRFWPRPQLCSLILTALERGESVSLFGPRRTGKSSLLKECARRLREDGHFTVIEVNGEGMDAVASLLNRFVAALPKGSFEAFKVRVLSLGIPDSIGKLMDRWRGKDGAGGEDAAQVTRHWATLAQAIARLVANPRPSPRSSAPLSAS